jgi:hypothetical protein
MWDKWVVRTLAAVYILGGVATLITPERMGRFARWFADNPLYMRLDGIAVTALGVFLALRENQKEEPPPPWWRRLLGA